MQRRHPLDALGQPAGKDLPAGLIAHVHIVMGLSPVVSDEDHVKLHLTVLVSGIMDSSRRALRAD